MNPAMMPDEQLERLYSSVSRWAEDILDEYEPPTVTRGKVVRDAVHGFHSLAPHEIALIDSPIFQRLRYIHQNGLAHLV